MSYSCPIHFKDVEMTKGKKGDVSANMLSKQRLILSMNQISPIWVSNNETNPKSFGLICPSLVSCLEEHVFCRSLDWITLQ